MVTIYTDGACKNNPGPGGWAAILIFATQEKIITGSELYTTNNRMELLSVINALDALNNSSEIDLYTDSQYVQQGITKWIFTWRVKNWRTSNGAIVKNQYLWQRLEKASSKHKIFWHWVKGHNGNLFNEKVDFLARQSIPSGK